MRSQFLGECGKFCCTSLETVVVANGVGVTAVDVAALANGLGVFFARGIILGVFYLPSLGRGGQIDHICGLINCGTLGSEKDESMNWLPGRMRQGVMPACAVVEGGRLANAIMVLVLFVFVSPPIYLRSLFLSSSFFKWPALRDKTPFFLPHLWAR